jgi:hypothetical protein
MKNWKTTVAGVLTVIIAVSMTVKSLLLGTPVDWSAVITSLTAAATGLGLWAAKDA